MKIYQCQHGDESGVAWSQADGPSQAASEYALEWFDKYGYSPGVVAVRECASNSLDAVGAPFEFSVSVLTSTSVKWLNRPEGSE